jgi:hypothetical protein
VQKIEDVEGSRVPRVALAAAGAAEVQADVLAVPVAAGAPLDPALAALGETVSGFVVSGEHRGRLDDVLLIPSGEGIAARRVLLYGLGSAADLDGQRLRFAHQEMVRVARTYGHRRIAVLRAGPLRAEDAAAVVEGCVAGGWDRRARATGDRPAPLEEVALVGFDGAGAAAVEVAGQLGAATARARAATWAGRRPCSRRSRWSRPTACRST